jgi:flagellar basal-body rod modification protein FlgD
MISPSATSQSVRDEFLTLLVTQLRHQDPLEPVQQQDFLSQLAQFSTLEGIEGLNSTFADMLAMQQLTQGAQLVGRPVVFESPLGLEQGTITSVLLQDDKLTLVVDGSTVVGLEQVREIA